MGINDVSRNSRHDDYSDVISFCSRLVGIQRHERVLAVATGGGSGSGGGSGGGRGHVFGADVNDGV